MLGERALLISWEEKIDEDLLYFILSVKQIISDKTPQVSLEINNTYNSLLIKYPSTIEDFYRERTHLKELVNSASAEKKKLTRLYELPVCYDDEFGLDLEEVSEKNDLSKQEIIERHTAPDYTIYFTGFLPGFLYLGGLDEKLEIPRKTEPRLEIEKGAVGLAGNQTGIYPQKSAGGWQIIGNCPVPLFDTSSVPPTDFQPGYKLQFYQVSREKYDEIREAVQNETFKLDPKPYRL